MTRKLDVDYLVVGAGAMGMAFTDALIDHADVRVALVDRKHSVGGHWLDAYPFVRLHQASSFYGVASTQLGDGRVQQDGPEAGLHERATAPEICAYYGRVLTRMQDTGKVEFLGSTDYLGDRQLVSRLSGQRFEVPDRCRVVDATYLAPDIPQLTPPPFAVADGARVIPVNDLVSIAEAPSQYVVVGAGKTAMDACVWLLSRGVDPNAICWVRPREPWMLNRAVVQPDPVSFLGMVATVMESAIPASSPDDFFLRLEDAGVMIRIDSTVPTTMAKAPTIAPWEIEQLRTISNVVRLGHVTSVARGKVDLEHGSIDVAKDAVVVHCASSGLQQPPLVPIWGQGAMTLQPIRAGFPCFGAALAGYVEAVVEGDDEKNRLCPPTPYANTPAEWARMNVMGTAAVTASNANRDVRRWADQVALNPARILPEHQRPALDDVLNRMLTNLGAGLEKLEVLSRG
jgi:hypothetical protein